MRQITNSEVVDFRAELDQTISELVDEHDDDLDKRAALLSVESASLRAEEDLIGLDFFVTTPNRDRSQVALQLVDLLDPIFGNDGGEHPEIEAFCECGAALIPEDERDEDSLFRSRCSCTLAAAWWLQEQVRKQKSYDDLVGFFATLADDPVADGSDIASELLAIAHRVAATVSEEQLVIQWRFECHSAFRFATVGLTPYVQKLKKNGKGYTKGKRTSTNELLRRPSVLSELDRRICQIIERVHHGSGNDQEMMLSAVHLLARHGNVAWDDNDGEEIQVLDGQLSLRLEPIHSAVNEAGEEFGGLEESDPTTETAHYSIRMCVPGIDVDISQCSVFYFTEQNSQPLVLFIDRNSNRLILAHVHPGLPREAYNFLETRDFGSVVLDRESAHELTKSITTLNRLLPVHLPDELAGPVLDLEPELLIELRPRGGAGLLVRLSIFDQRLIETLTPGSGESIYNTVLDDGPVRLRRDLSGECVLANKTVEQFQLHELSSDGAYRWIALTDQQALDFLSRLYEAGEDAPRMIWPEGESLRIRGTIAPSSLRVQIDDSQDWFGVSGTVDIGGKQIALKDLLDAVTQRRNLVRVGDREFAQISDTFRSRLEQLGDTLVYENGEMKVADAAVPAVADLLGADVPLEVTARWNSVIDTLDALGDYHPDKPESLDVDYRDYQMDGFHWLARLSHWGVGGILADDMGLGKTVQALGVLSQRGADGPALVIAPTSVGGNWLRETERFAKALNPILYRDGNRQQMIESAGPNDVLIASYQLVQRDAQKFQSRQWNTLVLDEAQFVKNAQTKTARAIRDLAANWRLALSGTPLENHLGELWSLMRTISPGLLGSWDRFRTRFADPIERHKDDQRRESLARLVRPFILRRTKNNVLKELPRRTDITLQAHLGDEERGRYDEARVAALSELSDQVDEKAGEHRMRTLAWLTKLRQLSCHPRLVDRTWSASSAKLNLFGDLVDELRDGEHRALVFSQFVKHLGLVRELLDERGISYQYLDGATPAKERQRRVDAFQEGEGELFLISLKAGGTGLNLTAADYVIHMDPWWNPAVEDQATDRAHRIGQTRPVTVYRLVAAGTIEEKILEMHADKRELVAGVLDGTDRAAKMDTADLIRLIKSGDA